MKLQKAQKEQIKLRIGLSGASGFGKSYSALLMAYGITNNWNKIAVIDTENGSVNLYAQLGEFSTIRLNAPYSPERYIQAIKACENAHMEVIIIDSITHEWNGKGGCLQIHENLGGRFQDWAKVTPRHQAFIDTILQSSCHIITTVRRKTEFSLDQDSNGRMKVVKLGTKEQTREGFEYELTTNFELINDKHLCVASKDRTGLFMNKPEFVITSGTGKILREWCAKKDVGDSINVIENEIKRCTTLEGLRHIFTKYPDQQAVIREKLMRRKTELEDAKYGYLDNKEIIKDLKQNQNGHTTNDH